MHGKVSAPAPRTARQEANVGQNNKLTACHYAVLWPHVVNNVKINKEKEEEGAEERRKGRSHGKALRREGGVTKSWCHTVDDDETRSTRTNTGNNIS
jgi:hypothetical protein